MKTIQFTENQQIDFLLGHGLETFLAGQSYTFERDDKADRWISRGVAREVPYDKAAPVAAGEPLQPIAGEHYAAPAVAAPVEPAPILNEDMAELQRIREETAKKATKK